MFWLRQTILFNTGEVLANGPGDEVGEVLASGPGDELGKLWQMVLVTSWGSSGL